MKESEWLACTDPTTMLEHLRVAEAKLDRKLRLLLVACCYRVWALLADKWSRRAVEVAEKFADGQADEETRIYAKVTAEHAAHGADERTGEFLTDGTSDRHIELPGFNSAAAASRAASAASRCALPSDQLVRVYPVCGVMRGAAAAATIDVGHAIYNAALAEGNTTSGAEESRTREFATQARFLRDIFGNPFRSTNFSPTWRTNTAVSLARTMYESRDFSAMPILADALQDAGCDNAYILEHCRDTSLSHVRGCWVVDLVLCLT